MRYVGLGLSWIPEEDALSCNVYRGLLSQLSRTYHGECYRDGIEATFTAITEDPPIGKGYFYLITVELVGGEGSMGRDSDGIERYNGGSCF